LQATLLPPLPPLNSSPPPLPQCQDRVAEHRCVLQPRTEDKYIVGSIQLRSPVPREPRGNYTQPLGSLP